MPDSITLKAALAYAGRGWAVFPLREREKTPITFNGVKDATTDPKRIREWWAKHPDANVGIATGRSGLVVIDVDGEEGEAAWLTWQSDNGAVPLTPVAYTGSGGRHFVFAAPDGVDLAPGQAIFGPGSHVDVRAGESYIVGAGSTHPNGTMYEWDSESHPTQIKPAPLPDALRATLTAPRNNGATALDGIYAGPDVVSEGQDAYGASRAAVMARKGFSKDEARAALRVMIETRFAGGWAGLDDRRPWTPTDVERWIKGAFEKFYDPNGDLEENDLIAALLPGVTVPSSTAAPAPTEQAEKRHDWPEYTGDQLATMKDMNLDWLPVLGDEGWIVRGWSHLLSGFVRAGKTEFLTRNVREWIATEDPVYWLSEEGIQVWSLRLRGLDGEWEKLIVRPAMGMPVGDMFRDAMAAPGRIVIVDSLRNLLQIKDENDNAEMAAAVRPWVSGARKAGKTLILTHHSRKGGGEHGEGVSGGHGLISVIDVILEIKREQTADNRRILSNLARVVAHKREVYELEGTDMRFIGSPEGLKGSNLRDRVVEAMAGVEDWMTTSEVKARLTEPIPSRTMLSDTLNALVRSNRVERQQVGKAASWRLTENLLVGLAGGS